MFEAAATRLWSVATPYRTPHTNGELQSRVGCWSGYIVERVSHPGQKLGMWMATVVRLQDGEGWTPRSVHQSILVMGSICYRLLASEQPTPLAIQRACVKYAGKEALKGLLGWRASAKPPLIASGPPWAA
ncbi:hypothetical protein BU25DRAFT_480274 [Macroventuria anomochaeta]|uniref:Uncharacterized protein n=1 Tax=Macroventuria anomochaeta TaxID=301207 RepID=A0ACB6RN95_9PLEO|nr:uncharacterized protein BU25DRAFT_480274 [Macroventuria anomochaeta]KAF2622583.1 hypothetical protein BU25DRAFT_480274 [Macroventuria anomochaeta]